MPESLYIVDVSSIVFQVFHAIPEMTGRRGQPTNAVFGVTRDLFNIIRGQKPTYIVCAIDAEGPAERVAAYAEYKANRSEMPDNLRPQIPMVHEVIDAFGLCSIGHVGWEADDVIATVVEQALLRDVDVTIVSPDKDVRQLLAPRVRIYHARKDLFFTEAELLADWGIRPDQVIDFQSLVGDAVDNVPGVPQIGPKTATALLQQFGTLEAILERADEVKQNRVRENLKTYRDKAILSKDLVTLRRNLPLTVDWECARLGRYNVPRMAELFQDFNFRRFVDDAYRLLPKEAKPAKVAKPRVKRAAASPAGPSLFAEDWDKDEPTVTESVDAVEAPHEGNDGDRPEEDPPRPVPRPKKPQRPLTYHVVDTPEKFEDFVSRLQSQRKFALDLETTHLDATQAEIVGWAISWEPHVGYYLAVRGPSGSALLDPQVVVDRLKPILENPDVEVLNQNIKYDLIVLRRAGIHVAKIGLDPMVGHYLLDAGARTHNLDELALAYFGHVMIPISELIGKGRIAQRMDHVEVARVAEYAAEDAEIAFSLAERLEPDLRKEGLWDLYWNLERPLIEILAEMQLAGVCLNVQLLRELNAEAPKEQERLQREIHEAVGRTFNVDSPKQLAEILFKELKLPSRRRTGTGDSSTSQDVLEELASLHPVPKKVVEYRQLVKLKNTYLEALPEMVNPLTGRIHTSFNQVVAATGRLSSSEPNLQNIPIRTEAGRRIREAFVAAPGHVLVCADYSQIELRMLAHFSRDLALLAAFESGADIHTAVASEVYSVPLDQVTSDMRRIAKAVNYGVVYGQSAFGLAKSIGVSKRDAAKFIDDYFAKYSGVDDWLQQTLKESDQQGYAKTILGRKRAIEGIRKYGGRDRNLAERVAINTVVQGSAADLIKQAMLNVHGRLKRDQHPAKMLLQIHDELVFETPEDRVTDLVELVREEMEHAMELIVPVKVDITTGPNWMDQK